MMGSEESSVRPPADIVGRPVDGAPAGSLPALPLTPVAEAERINVVDALRGFALLGILLANIRFFATPFQVDQIGYRFWSQPHDAAIDWLLVAFVYGKFYTLFSALFGFGMAIQMERALARGRSFVPVYARRLGVLFVIGVLHATLLWAGDVLVTYALVGAILLLFRNCRPTTLLVWGGSLLAFMTLVGLALGGLMMLAAGTAEGVAEFAAREAEARTQFEQALRVYANGSFLDVTAQRLADLADVYVYTLFIVGDVLAMFLLGLWVARRCVLHAPDARRRLLWGVLLVAGPLGLAANVLNAQSFDRLFAARETPAAQAAAEEAETAGTSEPAPGVTTTAATSPPAIAPTTTGAVASAASDVATQTLAPVPTTEPAAAAPDSASTAFVLVLTLGFIASPLLMLAYAASFVLVWLTAAGRRGLSVLAAPGRMALTNYLTQSLVCSLLFYGYGLGLHGKIGPAACMPIALALFAAQVVFSHAWLARFRFGPAEWVWRSLTYGVRQPLRRGRAS